MNRLSTLCQQLSNRITTLESNSGSSGPGSGVDQSVIDNLNSKIDTIKTQLESGEFCKLNEKITKEQLSAIFGDTDIPERTYKEWIFMLIHAFNGITEEIMSINDRVNESMYKVVKNIDIITGVDETKQNKLFVSHVDGSLGMILALALDDVSETHKLAPIHDIQFLYSNVSNSITTNEEYNYQYKCDTIWICCNDRNRLLQICDTNYINPNFNPQEVKKIRYVSDINDFTSDYEWAFRDIPEVFPNVEYFYFDCPNITTFSMKSPACYFSKLVYHNFPANTIKLYDNIFGDDSYPLLNDTFTFDYPASIKILDHCKLPYSPSKTELKFPPNVESVSGGRDIIIPSECKTLYVDKALLNAWEQINLTTPYTKQLKSIILAEGITKTPYNMFYSLSDDMTDHPINVTLPTSLDYLDATTIKYNGYFTNSVLNYYVNGEKLMKKIEDKTVMDLGLLYNLDTISTESIDLYQLPSGMKLEIIIPDSVTKIVNNPYSEYIFNIDVNNLIIHIPSSIKETVENVSDFNYRSLPMTIKYHYKTGEDYTTNAFYQWLTTLSSSKYTIKLIEDN